MKQTLRLILVLLATLGLGSAGQAMETDCFMRDPSTIVKRGDTYWMYGTGRGIRQFSSTDLRHWTDREPAFPVEPSWVKKAVPGHQPDILWAPDIHLFHGTYYLYYCASVVGKNTSAIGFATNATLAEHRVGHGNAVEASCVYYRDGWYYLFVNWGSCLKGNKSTYSIHVGRSRAVTGPYLGKLGKDMTNGGGTLLLGSAYDDGSGQPVSPEVGPGHAGILTVDGQDYFSCHYEWARDNGGKTTVNVFKLRWDKDGWPDIPLAEQPL